MVLWFCFAKEEASIFTKNKYGFEEKLARFVNPHPKIGKIYIPRTNTDSKRRQVPSENLIQAREKMFILKTNTGLKKELDPFVNLPLVVRKIYIPKTSMGSKKRRAV